MTVTWDDVARQMAADTGKTEDHPSVRAAIDALRETKLRPGFVLETWQAVGGSDA